jgi:Matrixin
MTMKRSQALVESWLESDEEATVSVTEFVPTEDELTAFHTDPLPQGAKAIDMCGMGSQEYKHNSPLALWKTFPVGYFIENFPSDTVRQGIIDSFGVYNGLKSNFFDRVLSTAAKIKISFGSIDAPGQTLAKAQWWYSTSSLSLTRATITFDSNERWGWLDRESCGSNGSTYDIGNVATHEIGHLVCLAHAPTDSLQTMFASTSPGKTLGRSLGNGDILGIRKAYNLPEPQPTPPTPQPEKNFTVHIGEMQTILDDANDVLDQMRKLQLE